MLHLSPSLCFQLQPAELHRDELCAHGDAADHDPAAQPVQLPVPARPRGPAARARCQPRNGTATSTSFLTISHADLSDVPPYTRRVMCSTWCTAVSDPDSVLGTRCCDQFGASGRAPEVGIPEPVQPRDRPAPGPDRRHGLRRRPPGAPMRRLGLLLL